MPRAQAPVGAPKDAPATSDLRRRLEALRDLLEARLPDAGDRELPGLVGRYESVLARLSALPDAKKASDVDDLAAKRARRRSAASAS